MLQRTTYPAWLGTSGSVKSTDVFKVAGLLVLAALAVLALASTKVELPNDPEAIAMLYGP